MPREKPHLRSICTNMPNYGRDKMLNISYDIEYGISRIIEQEIKFIQDVEPWKKALY